MSTAIKHPMPGRVKPSFVIFDIRALWRSACCAHVAPLGVKGLTRRRWPDPIHIVRPGVQIPAQHGSWIGYLAEFCRPVSSIDGQSICSPWPAWSTFHELHCQHTEDARSVVCLERSSCLSQEQYLCLTLRTSSNISTSRHTSAVIYIARWL